MSCTQVHRVCACSSSWRQRNEYCLSPRIPDRPTQYDWDSSGRATFPKSKVKHLPVINTDLRPKSVLTLHQHPELVTNKKVNIVPKTVLVNNVLLRDLSSFKVWNKIKTSYKSHTWFACLSVLLYQWDSPFYFCVFISLFLLLRLDLFMKFWLSWNSQRSIYLFLLSTEIILRKDL